MVSRLDLAESSSNMAESYLLEVGAMASQSSEKRNIQYFWSWNLAEIIAVNYFWWMDRSKRSKNMLWDNAKFSSGKCFQLILL